MFLRALLSQSLVVQDDVHDNDDEIHFEEKEEEEKEEPSGAICL